MEEDNEIWKTYYQGSKVTWEVSNFGRVKKNGEIYECKPNNRGYLIFRSKIYVHRAVAQLFISNPNNYNEIDHIDGNKLNNYYLNLRWCTHKQNMNNPITRKQISESQKGKVLSKEQKKKLSESKKGEKHPMYGKKHSQTTKAKISESLKGEKHPMYGKTHSEETKRKMSESHKGLQAGEKNKNSLWHKTHKKVLCEDGKYHWV